jgi:hypothetical protein
MALGFGTLIGSTLGELLGGIVVDRSMYLSRKGKGGEAVPEVRLQGIWAGAIIQPVRNVFNHWCFIPQLNLVDWASDLGLLLAIQKWVNEPQLSLCSDSILAHWIGPTMGFTVMCFAIQCVSTSTIR